MLLAALGLALCAGAAAADDAKNPISGPAHVIDGATLEIAVRVRLAGIDAPDYTAICTRSLDSRTHALPWLRDAVSFPCGRESAEKLRALSEGRVVTCIPKGRDNKGRLLAACSTPDTPDIGTVLMEEGSDAR